MRRFIGSSGASLVLLALVSVSLGAQQRQAPVSVEVRGGYTLPVGAFSSDIGAQSDFGYGAAVTLGLSPSFGVYGGWARDVFRCEACGPREEIVTSAFELGGTFIIPDRARAHPWVRAGLIAPRSLLRMGAEAFESSRHVGFQAAVGLDAPVGALLSISPSVRFNSFTSEFDGMDVPFRGVRPRTDFRYLSFDVAARIHLR